MRVDVRGLDAFIKKLKKATSGELKEKYNIWLEAMGLKFLDVVQDEIIRLGVVDTRRLLNSFDKGDSGCIFSITNNGLALKVGTNVVYAGWVNDGHKLRGGGWWEGYHYFDVSLLIFERIFTASLERNLQEWLDTF
jgi:hypothetical protein